MNTSADPRIPVEYASKLADARVYATNELFDVYSWLHANNPLGLAEIEGFDPFWVVTKYEDILEVSKFPYGNNPSTFMNKSSRNISMQMSESPLALSLIQMDEPMHMKYRLLTQPWFMPANIKKREVEIREIAKKAAARMAEMNGEGDFVGEVSLNYPLEVIMNILGVPEKDFPFMLRLTQEIFGPQDPDTQKLIESLSTEDISKLQIQVVGELIEYFDTITKARRENPTDDLASVIANAVIDGEPISDNAMNGYYLVVATAGHDTTSSSASIGMWALATQEGLLQRLQADPTLLTAFIDESIRWASPVKNFMRSAPEDVEIRGRKIKKGDWLMLCYAAGNRDDAAFENPYSFDIDRKPNKHVAFGFGPHLCLGQHLAKMELRILFEELLPKLKSVKLTGDPQMLESFFINGLKKLPIQFEMTE